MTGLDLDCGDAADEIITRGRNHERTMAVITSALAAEAKLLSALARHVAADQPRTKPRRNRSFVLRRGEDGVMAAEDIEVLAAEAAPEPAAAPAKTDTPRAPCEAFW